MQPTYRGDGTPERTGSLSFLLGAPYQVDLDYSTLQERVAIPCPLHYGIPECRSARPPR